MSTVFLIEHQLVIFWLSELKSHYFFPSWSTSGFLFVRLFLLDSTGCAAFASTSYMDSKQPRLRLFLLLFLLFGQSHDLSIVVTQNLLFINVGDLAETVVVGLRQVAWIGIVALLAWASSMVPLGASRLANDSVITNGTFVLRTAVGPAFGAD